MASAAGAGGKPVVVQSAGGTVTDAVTAARLAAGDAAVARLAAGVEVNQWSIDTVTRKPVKRERFIWYQPAAATSAGGDGKALDAKDAKAGAAVALVDPKKPPPLGTLFWCDRKAGALDAAQRRADASVGSVDLDDVTDLFFGKRIQIFALMAVGSAGSTIPEQRCFSVVFAAGTFSAEALADADAACIGAALQHVIGSSNWKIVKLNRGVDPSAASGGGGADVAAAEAANGGAVALKSVTFKTRRAALEVDPRMADDYVIDKTAVADNAHVQRLSLDGGSAAKLNVFEMGPNRVARIVKRVIFFDLSIGPAGALVCTIPAVYAKLKSLNAERADAARAIAAGASGAAADAEAKKLADADAELAELQLSERLDTAVLDLATPSSAGGGLGVTRVYMGKQSQLLLAPVAQTAVEANCFTLVGAKTVICEAEAKDTAATVLGVLRHVAPFAKHHVVEEPRAKDKHATAQEIALRRTYAVLPKPKPRNDQSDDEAGEGEGEGEGEGGHGDGCDC